MAAGAGHHLGSARPPRSGTPAHSGSPPALAQPAGASRALPAPRRRHPGVHRRPPRSAPGLTCADERSAARARCPTRSPRTHSGLTRSPGRAHALPRRCGPGSPRPPPGPGAARGSGRRGRAAAAAEGNSSPALRLGALSVRAEPGPHGRAPAYGPPTAGMSPQKPPGESAVSSAPAENPGVAPGRRAGARRARPRLSPGGCSRRGGARDRPAPASSRPPLPPWGRGQAPASFPGPPPPAPAPPPPGIFGTFLSCANFLPLPRSGPAPDLDLHRILPATPGRAAGGDQTLPQAWAPSPAHPTPTSPLPPSRVSLRFRRASETLGSRTRARSRQTRSGLAQRHGQMLRPSESHCLP